MKVVIGIDPDSKAHGVATYLNKELCYLQCLTLIEIMESLKEHLFAGDDIKVIMENTKANNANFQKGRMSAAVQKDIGRRIGMVQQSQTELERLLDHLGVQYELSPISKAWKKDKKQFEMVTGWTARSNEDTRSAAYFGWLGLRK